MAGAKMKRRVACHHIFKNWFLVAVWVSVTGALFSWAYFRYHHEPRYFYTRQILGQWLCVSRGTAAILHLCMACIVFPVSRFLHIIMARMSIPKRLPKICTSILMLCRKFHIICAVTLITASAVHTISHIANAYNFSTHYNHRYPEINWGLPGQSSLSLIFSSVVGLTGLGMLLLLLIMTLTSMDRARKNHYNYFWLSHHLALLTLLLLYLVHPLSNIIKEVSNIEQHNPLACALDNITFHNHSTFSSADTDFKSKCEEPIFRSPSSDAWKWLIIPFLLLAIDTIMRVSSLFKNTFVSSVAILPGDAVEIFILCPGFKCTPGQYVLLQIPRVSNLEWHPFTIVKCPSDKDNNFSVIIKARGDWTKQTCNELLNQCIIKHSFGNMNKPTEVSKICIFGPFASPMEQMVSCKNLVCIGAGIGITPFMAFLKHLLANKQNSARIEQLKFLWLCSDPSQLLWFSWTISTLHNQFWEQNRPEAFTYSIFVTRNNNAQSINSLLQTKYPLVATRVHYGRPKLEHFFQDVKAEFSGKNSVNLFGCGSEKLMQELEFRSKDISKGKTKFCFIREAYS